MLRALRGEDLDALSRELRISQSRLVVDKLRALGRREGEDFTYVQWDDEGHGSVDIAAKDRRFSLGLDWLSDTLAA